MKHDALFGWMMALVALLFFGCKAEEKKPEAESAASAAAPKAGPVSLNGAGATFPYPLYSKWMSEYNHIHPDVQINYQSIGSGGGIRQIQAKTVDFGATDAPMTPDEESKAPGVLHVPTTIGAVAVCYNLPGAPELKLGPEELVAIYQGSITKWNDPKIAAQNAGVTLPDTAIVVAYRSDGSGTTAVFTDYLGKVSPDWKEKVGVGKSVKWPVGLGAKGNEGVTGQIKTTPGAVGYVELAYAMQNSLPTVALKNAAGKYVKPSIAAISAAAGSVELPESLTASITNAAGDEAYPISAFTYVLVYADTPDLTRAQALASFLWWAAHDGQKLSEALHYAPLPAPVVAKVEARLKSLKSGATVLLSGS